MWLTGDKVKLSFHMMIQLENESKFRILKNRKALETAVVDLLEECGYVHESGKYVDQLDCYLDCNMALFNSGYSLRHRYVEGLLKDITLKTLETLDQNAQVRMEEKGKTYDELMKKVTSKLRSIFQDPADEKAIEILSVPANLSPVVAVTKGRMIVEFSKGSQKGLLAFDSYTYIIPLLKGPFFELEIEGPSAFDALRQDIITRFGKGRNPYLGVAHKSKFLLGLANGGENAPNI
jgi:hypothetical protein